MPENLNRSQKYRHEWHCKQNPGARLTALNHARGTHSYLAGPCHQLKTLESSSSILLQERSRFEK